MDAWQRVAERKIEEAMAEGVFDRLQGEGRPLNLEENPFEDPAERMANRLLRNNGFAPAILEEARAIDAEAEELRGETGASGDGHRAERVRALNRRIQIFNLKAPSIRWHRLPVRGDRG